jgi:ribosomal-protein-alanine N-acetyltransferase
LIKGVLVRIRNVRETDLDEFYSLSSDYEDPGDFMPLNFVSEVAFKTEFADTGFWKDHCGKLLIEDSSGQIVGEAGLFKAAHYIDGREIYYRIFSGYRGKGYACEALALLIKFSFESSSMNRIQAVTVQGNDVSEHMLKKSGFVFEGTMRQARYFKGRLVDLNLFSCVRTECLV